jgi:CBS domain-containing protein
MQARNIMTRDVITAGPAMPVKGLANLLIKNQISGVPVVDGRGKIIGVVSEADIIAKKGKDVRSIMSKKLYTVEEETPIEKIAQLMSANKIARLPVLSKGRIVGIVSRADIIGAIAAGEPVGLHTPVYDL